MTALAARPLDDPRLALADRIARRVMGQSAVDPATRDAVSLLTASADPDRAGRLAVRPGELGPLVERLAVWALHRAPDEAVARAEQILDGDDLAPGAAPAAHAHAPIDVIAPADAAAEAPMQPACC